MLDELVQTAIFRVVNSSRTAMMWVQHAYERDVVR